MTKDTDLDALHGDPRWDKTLAAVEKASFPCEHDPKNRELDFWLGDRDVVDAKGNPLGSSRVELMLNDCVLLENWTGGGGSAGKSLNIWDAGRKEWRQTWVDDSGSLHNYHGDFRDGAMRFEGELYDASGPT